MAELARVEDGVLRPPYIKRLENSTGRAYDGEFRQVKGCRIFHMGMEGKAQQCAVPIIWKRILNPGVVDRDGAPMKREDYPLIRVECIGLVWGEFVGRPQEYVVTTRFDIPLEQYIALQVGIVEL